jgi:hypothetical protein
MLAVKKIDRPEFQRRTNISSDQMGRILSGKRGPGDKIAVMVLALEIDADYLLGTDRRYDKMEPLRAAALMALDRYINDKWADDDPVDVVDERTMRALAAELSEPPVWTDDWKKQHESIVVTARARETTSQSTPRTRQRRSSRVPS